MIWATDSSTSCFRWLYRTFLSFVAKNIVVAQSLTCVWLFVTPFTAAHQVSLFFTISQSMLILTPIESVIPSNHLILLPPSLFALNLSQHQGLFQWVRSFPMSQLFASGDHSIGASASVLPMNIQDWLPLGFTGWISLQSKGLSSVFSNTTVQKHRFFGPQPSLRSNSSNLIISKCLNILLQWTRTSMS